MVATGEHFLVSWVMKLLLDCVPMSTALLCYEYCITFSIEVRSIWKRKLSTGSAIFFLNRYVALFGRLARITQLVQWRNVPDVRADQVTFTVVSSLHCNRILPLDVREFIRSTGMLTSDDIMTIAKLQYCREIQRCLCNSCVRHDSW